MPLEFFLGEDSLEQVKTPVPHHRNHVVALDIYINLLPRGPVSEIYSLAVIVDMRIGEGAAKDVENIRGCLIPIFLYLLVVQPAYLEACNLVELLQVMQEGRL